MWAIWEVSEVIGGGFHTARLCAIELASCNASCVSRLHGAVKRVDKRTVRSVIIISVDLLGIGLPWARFLHPSMQVVGFEKFEVDRGGRRQGAECQIRQVLYGPMGQMDRENQAGNPVEGNGERGSVVADEVYSVRDYKYVWHGRGSWMPPRLRSQFYHGVVWAAALGPIPSAAAGNWEAESPLAPHDLPPGPPG